MNKLLKKLLVCGASLMMITSLSTGINNVSAKRVHHHSHKTSLVSHKRRMFKSNKTKQHAQYKAVTKYLNYVAKYDKSHSKKLNSYKIRHLSRYMNYLTYSQKKTMFKRLNKIQKMNVKGHKNNKKYRRAKFHHNRKYNLKKRNKKQIAKRHTVKRNRKLKKATKKHTNKRNNHKAKLVTNAKKNTNSTNNAPTTLSKHNTSSAQSSQPYDETDGGKYYSWGQLQNVLNSDAVTGGYESDSTDQKIKGTIMHNLNHYNWKQDNALLSNGGAGELNDISPQLFNDVNNAYGFAYGMRKVL